MRWASNHVGLSGREVVCCVYLFLWLPVSGLVAPGLTVGILGDGVAVWSSWCPPQKHHQRSTCLIDSLAKGQSC